MADPMVVAQLRADAVERLKLAGPKLASALGIDPPVPVSPEAAKDHVLRDARTLESLADFIERADRAARPNNDTSGEPAVSEPPASKRRRG